ASGSRRPGPRRGRLRRCLSGILGLLFPVGRRVELRTASPLGLDLLRELLLPPGELLEIVLQAGELRLLPVGGGTADPLDLLRVEGSTGARAARLTLVQQLPQVPTNSDQPAKGGLFPGPGALDVPGGQRLGRRTHLGDGLLQRGDRAGDRRESGREL